MVVLNDEREAHAMTAIHHPVECPCVFCNDVPDFIETTGEYTVDGVRKQLNMLHDKYPAFLENSGRNFLLRWAQVNSIGNTTVRLGVEHRCRRWCDRNGNRWHWNSREAQWRKTVQPDRALTEPGDPDPQYFGPWTAYRREKS
jgi:hypothetical protein